MNKDELRRLFYSALSRVINIIDVRFSHQNTELCAVVSAFQPENSNFLSINMVQSILDLVDRTSEEAEFDVAKTYVANFNGGEKTKPTTIKLLSEHRQALKAGDDGAAAPGPPKNRPTTIPSQ